MSMTHHELVDQWFEGKRAAAPNRKGQAYTRVSGNLLMDEEALYSYGSHFPLVKECPTGYILNGDNYSPTTSQHQSMVRSAAMNACRANGKRMVTIPFSALREARVRPEDVILIQAHDDQYRRVKHTDPKTGEEKEREEHLLGGALVRTPKDSGAKPYPEAPSKPARYFTSGVDPTAHWGRGYFLTELPGAVETIEAAFEILKPPEVKQAEPKGLEVKRQGEWFFIPQPGLRLPRKEVQKKAALPSRNGTFAHHYARDLVRANGDLLVRGTVRHQRWGDAEHRMLRLGEVWNMAVPNTQVASWGTSGRVD